MIGQISQNHFAHIGKYLRTDNGPRIHAHQGLHLSIGPELPRSEARVRVRRTELLNVNVLLSEFHLVRLLDHVPLHMLLHVRQTLDRKVEKAEALHLSDK